MVEGLIIEGFSVVLMLYLEFLSSNQRRISMSYSLICSQGRVGDKTNNTIRGAMLTAKALEKHLNVKAKVVGTPSPAKNDNWEECLPEASKTLGLLQRETRNSLLSNSKVLLASNTCSASLATLPIVVGKYPDVMVLWVDAHGDFNTPDTSESGYLGGMVLGAVCGQWNSGYEVVKYYWPRA